MKSIRAIVALAVLVAAVGAPVLLGASVVGEARIPTGREDAVSGSTLEELDPYPAFEPPIAL